MLKLVFIFNLNFILVITCNPLLLSCVLICFYHNKLLSVIHFVYQHVLKLFPIGFDSRVTSTPKVTKTTPAKDDPFIESNPTISSLSKLHFLLQLFCSLVIIHGTNLSSFVQWVAIICLNEHLYLSPIEQLTFVNIYACRFLPTLLSLGVFNWNKTIRKPEKKNHLIYFSKEQRLFSLQLEDHN